MVLVIYFNNSFPMRRSVRDHLYSFRRYLPVPVAYVNAARRDFDRSAAFSEDARPHWSLIVFHTTFLSAIRWDASLYDGRVERARTVRDWPALRAAFPQDEFYNPALLERFFMEASIDHVFSAAPRSEWPKIYPSIDLTRICFHGVLTGYLEDAAIRRAGIRAARPGTRPISVGYRAWQAEPWLGRLGRLKAEIGDVFRMFDAPDFRVDVSTDPGDTLLGNAWIDFLLSCRATLGTGSGASILDRDGSLRERVRDYRRDRPDATYEEVEAACFPNRDGELELNVIAPRHLEACLTRTCQVLVRGPYSGILEEDLHYVPLEPDFGNVDDVVAKIRSEAFCRKLAERAYGDVVMGGDWTYRTFMRKKIAPLLDHASGPIRRSRSPSTQLARLTLEHNAVDALLAARYAGPGWLARVLRRIGIQATPESVVARANRVRRFLLPRSQA